MRYALGPSHVPFLARRPQPSSPFFNSISRTPVQGPLNIPFAAAKMGISLGPAEMLDQLNRYLQHLNELRRTNEGDDTADSPGYLLNLVRVPVSVPPGKKTYEGYGAEVTMTLTPYLSDELLPTTFRNLVLNDLVDQIGVPLTQLLNDKEFVKKYLAADIYHDVLGAEEAEFTAPETAPAMPRAALPPGAPAAAPDGSASYRSPSRKEEKMNRAPTAAGREALKDLAAVVVAPAIPNVKVRRAKPPFPPSQILDIYGYAFAYRVAYDAHQSLSADPANRAVVHLPDVQGYLQEEVFDAYRFLADAKNADLWTSFCTPELVSAIRAWPVIPGEAALAGGLPEN